MHFGAIAYSFLHFHFMVEGGDASGFLFLPPMCPI